jgi:hypothetical protein
MGIGVIISPHDFKEPSRWYYRAQEVTKYEFGVIIYVIPSMSNFIKILTGIPELLNAHKWISQLKFELGSVRLMMRMSRRPCTMASSSLHITISSNRHVGIGECMGSYKVCVWSNHPWHSVHNKFHLHPYNQCLVIDCAQTDITAEVQVRWGLVGFGLWYACAEEHVKRRHHSTSRIQETVTVLVGVS